MLSKYGLCVLVCEVFGCGAQMQKKVLYLRGLDLLGMQRTQTQLSENASRTWEKRPDASLPSSPGCSQERRNATSGRCWERGLTHLGTTFCSTRIPAQNSPKKTRITEGSTTRIPKPAIRRVGQILRTPIAAQQLTCPPVGNRAGLISPNWLEMTSSD